MRTIEAMRRSGVGVGPEQFIRDAAEVMEQAGVGALAIIDGDRLVGIATDRDLVRRGLAKGLSHEARVDAVMTAPVVTIDADADLHDAFALLRTHAVRRLAVVRGAQFVGLVTLDDLLIGVRHQRRRPCNQSIQHRSIVPVSSGAAQSKVITDRGSFDAGPRWLVCSQMALQASGPSFDDDGTTGRLVADQVADFGLRTPSRPAAHRGANLGG